MVGNTLVTLARVALRCAHRQYRDAVQRLRGVRGIGGGQAAVTEGGAGADDPRSDRADDDVETLACRPEQSRRRRHAFDVTIQTGTDRNRRFEDRKSTRLNSSHVAISYA